MLHKQLPAHRKIQVLLSGIFQNIFSANFFILLLVEPAYTEPEDMRVDMYFGDSVSNEIDY